MSWRLARRPPAAPDASEQRHDALRCQHMRLAVATFQHHKRFQPVHNFAQRGTAADEHRSKRLQNARESETGR